MDINFFIRGLLIGLSVAAAVGPMCILCIQRTLQRGFLYGLVSGLGIATADGLYGSVAGFGLSVIATFLIHQQLWIRTIGGLFLIYLGIRTFLTKPAVQAAMPSSITMKKTNFASAYASTFLLTLTNPLTILSFVAIFAGLGVGVEKNTFFSALLVVCGVFLGSSLWWLILTRGISLLRRRFTPQWLLWINRISGCTIAIFGLLALLSLLTVL